MYMFRARYLLALPLLFFTVPGEGAAQILPIPRGTDWEEQRTRFSSEALRDFSAMLADWSAATAAADARSASRIYSEGAILHLHDGPPAQGRAEIERVLREALPRTGQIRTGVGDFSVSGNLAYGLGRFSYDERVDGTTTSITGTYVVVAERQGRSWRIRSQVFKPETSLD